MTAPKKGPPGTIRVAKSTCAKGRSWGTLSAMQRSYTRGEFLQAGLGLLAVAAGCGDDGGAGGSGGTGHSGGAAADGGAGAGASPGSGGAGGTPSDGGSPATGGGGSTAANPSVGGGGGAAPSSCTGAIVALISANHGHELTVPLADIEAGVDKTYDVSGSAQHCHEVTLTAADFLTLQSGGTVTKATCNGTNHEFTLSCGEPPQPGSPDCAATPQQGACN
jgi:hypothetical protein